MKMLNRENENKMTTPRKTRHEYHETSLQEKTANKTTPPPKKKQTKNPTPKPPKSRRKEICGKLFFFFNI